MTKEIISRYPRNGNKEQDDEVTNVLLEEYRSLIRLAQVFAKNGINSFSIQTPLGDFHFRDEEVIKNVELIKNIKDDGKVFNHLTQ